MAEKLRIFLAILIGFIRCRETRRRAMFLFTLGAICCLFLGATLFDSYLSARPLVFLGYWGICVWLTLCALLLALYDMFAVNAEALRERRRLREDLRTALTQDKEHKPEGDNK